MDPDMTHALLRGVVFYLMLAGSVALHEFGHAKAADMLGDPLPARQGRVTLNPLAHLDPIGTGLVPLVTIFFPILTGSHLAIGLIGWGRPVQISLPYPETRKRDEILITLAGPGMNVVIATVTSIVAGFVWRSQGGDEPPDWAKILLSLNCSLIAFNLIPLPPLDGSRILRHVIGISHEAFMRLAQVAPLILIVLINLNSFQNFLWSATGVVATPFVFLLHLIAGNVPQ